MKVVELLETEQKMAFKAVFKLGRTAPRVQHFTHKTISNCKVLTRAEINKVLKLQVGSSLSTHFDSAEGRTMVYVTREK